MNSWTERDGYLVRKFEFENFSEAFGFMARVALEAERMQHHPTWKNEYNKLEIRLSTHDAGGVVKDRDKELSRRIDALLEASR